ncbi:hypothetical protein HanIR_Chr08g0343551 [Helianthus annuus]|nr:hypothetical protein HanIR_Chr08g0343551 [Helianthus annuus]
MLRVTMVEPARTMSKVWATTSIGVMPMCHLVNYSTSEALWFSRAIWASMTVLVWAPMAAMVVWAPMAAMVPLVMGFTGAIMPPPE